ncbi:MAG: class I SAM-dependent methyltransferase [Rhodanobacteraceae bacterium]
MTKTDTRTPDDVAAPSPWVVRFANEIPAGGSVLDVACGRGRHARLLLGRGHPVTAVDRDISGLEDLCGEPRLVRVRADLEVGPWPLPGAGFAGVVVTNYLWRPLLADIVASVAPGGVLIYATFASGQERFGHPSNPEFLLRPGELPNAVVAGGLQTIAYEHGLVGGAKPAMRSRICARRPQ